MQQIFVTKGVAHANPKIESPTLRSQEIARVRDEHQKMVDEMRADVARYREKVKGEEAKERAERSTRNGILGKVVVGVGIATLTSQANITDEAKVQIMSATAQDLASNGEGRATANLLGSVSTPNSSVKTPGVSKAASRSDELWLDDYSNTVIATGKTTVYPVHERNIPGDVIDQKVGSRSAAQGVWSGQGGTVTAYSGCNPCRVGDTISVTVRFGQIIDQHVYRRVK